MDTLPAPAIHDPYYGLLSDPPGEYGLIAYGNNRAVILKGSEAFLDRALCFLHSYAGGRMDGPTSGITEVAVRRRHATGAVMVPISEERLRRALSVYLFTQLYAHRAPADRHQYDEEGEYVGCLDLTPDQDQAIQREADELAASFIALIDHDSLATGFQQQFKTTPVEHDVGSMCHHIPHDDA